MKLKNILAAACCLLLGTPLIAHAWDNGGVNNVTIERVVMQQDGTFYIEADRDLCDSGDNRVGYVYKDVTLEGRPWTQEGAEMMLSTAMAAHLSGRTVTVYADNSGSRWGCQMGAIALE